jgi:Cu/Ag efflux protein CusF
MLEMMHAKTNAMGVAVGLLTLTIFVCLAAQAAEMRHLVLKPGQAGQGAKGEATIVDKDPATKEITLAAEGLKPNAIYTVWVVNMKPKMEMAGVGSGDYSFKSDASGRGQYMGTLSAAELAKWQMLEIAYHPDGNPKNMKQMDVVLEAELK